MEYFDGVMESVLDGVLIRDMFSFILRQAGFYLGLVFASSCPDKHAFFILGNAHSHCTI